MKAAGQVFKLAVGLNFIQGRRTKTVAAVCLYIACRRQDGNTIMLIDFADVLMVSSRPFVIYLPSNFGLDQCVQARSNLQSLAR